MGTKHWWHIRITCFEMLVMFYSVPESLQVVASNISTNTVEAIPIDGGPEATSKRLPVQVCRQTIAVVPAVNS